MRESLDCIYYSCSKKRFFTLEASVDAQNCVLQFFLIGIKISQSQFCPKLFSDHWYVPCSINLTSHSHLILRHGDATQHRSLIVVLWIKPPFNQYADQIKKNTTLGVSQSDKRFINRDTLEWRGANWLYVGRIDNYGRCSSYYTHWSLYKNRQQRRNKLLVSSWAGSAGVCSHYPTPTLCNKRQN